MIYDIHITTCRVLSYHWKLRAIESIQMSSPAGVKLPEEEFSKVVDTLIDDHKIKNMVAKAIYPQLTNNEKYPRQQKEEPQSIKVQASTIRHLHGEV
jgi:polyhydroxyalkanoate synthesis regulator phasin